LLVDDKRNETYAQEKIKQNKDIKIFPTASACPCDGRGDRPPEVGFNEGPGKLSPLSRVYIYFFKETGKN